MKSATKKQATRKTSKTLPKSPPPAPKEVDHELPRSKRDRRRAHQRREDRRNELWPDSDSVVWSRKTNDGFTTIPRVLPLMSVLLRHLTERGDGEATSVYYELWARTYDEGYVQIVNQHDHAYASGYTSTRGVRTWQERMRVLEDHGFISIQANGAQDIGHVLLINPLLVAARLKQKGVVPVAWWAAFRSRVDEIGAEIPVIPNK